MFKIKSSLLFACLWDVRHPGTHHPAQSPPAHCNSPQQSLLWKPWTYLNWIPAPILGFSCLSILLISVLWICQDVLLSTPVSHSKSHLWFLLWTYVDKASVIHSCKASHLVKASSSNLFSLKTQIAIVYPYI